jgi:hypothetical protein
VVSATLLIGTNFLSKRLQKLNVECSVYKRSSQRLA